MSGTSHHAGAAWWLGLLLVAVVFAGARAGAGAPPPVLLEGLPELTPTHAADAQAAGGPPPIGAPVHLAIPDVGVRAAIRPVALDASGALVTPPAQDAGWYELGPRPGQRGPAVVVGHVDSRTAPGVFAQLASLRPGGLVGVRDELGVWTVFRVTSLSRHPKEALPPQLWSPTRDRLLRLITCGGDFDRRTGHYRDNVVAHAEALGRWRPPAADPGTEPPWERLRTVR